MSKFKRYWLPLGVLWAAIATGCDAHTSLSTFAQDFARQVLAALLT